jgi:hypothetical protein
MSHIQQMRDLYASNKEQVKALLKWDEQQYNDFMFESAYKYFTDGMLMPYEFQHALARLPMFWNFWVNQWNFRDHHEYLPNVVKITNATPEQVYRYVHSYKYMDAAPSRKLFDEAYAIMIGDSFESIKQLETV